MRTYSASILFGQEEWGTRTHLASPAVRREQDRVQTKCWPCTIEITQPNGVAEWLPLLLYSGGPGLQIYKMFNHLLMKWTVKWLVTSSRVFAHKRWDLSLPDASITGTFSYCCSHLILCRQSFCKSHPHVTLLFGSNLQYGSGASLDFLVKILCVALNSFFEIHDFTVSCKFY
jgi:hypothetical protein